MALEKKQGRRTRSARDTQGGEGKKAYRDVARLAECYCTVNQPQGLSKLTGVEEDVNAMLKCVCVGARALVSMTLIDYDIQSHRRGNNFCFLATETLQRLRVRNDNVSVCEGTI